MYDAALSTEKIKRLEYYETLFERCKNEKDDFTYVSFGIHS